MFAATTFEEIEMQERNVENLEIVIFLFARSTDKDTLNEFEYIHYNSERYCSIYAIGYTDNPYNPVEDGYKLVNDVFDNNWYFSMRAYVEFKNKLEQRIKWKYSGETEVLILQNNPYGREALNFQNYVAINITRGVHEGYIDSFQSFMESLVRSARAHVTVKDVANDMFRTHLSVKKIIMGSIEECKNLPKPIREIMKDRLFYRSARTF